MATSKREQLVHKALILFNRQGIQATGMEDLVTKTGVSKTTIYKHFDTKDDLICACLQLHTKHWMEHLQEALDACLKADESPLHAPLKQLEETLLDSRFTGCILSKAVAEFPSPRHQVHKAARAAKAEQLSSLQEIVLTAKAEGSAEQGARLFFQTLEGAMSAAVQFDREEAISDAFSLARLRFAQVGKIEGEVPKPNSDPQEQASVPPVEAQEELDARFEEISWPLKSNQ